MGKKNKVESQVEEMKEMKEEKKEEPKPPSSPVVRLSMQLHCLGCIKKIEKFILKMKGVEGVVTDFAINQLSIKGVVELQLMCDTIEKKTKRKVQILSPLPETKVQPTQVSGSTTTMELHVNMHCEACAAQLKKMILKMKGVTSVETELNTGKVRVTGTMEANKVVDYVYRRTKKQAKVVPQPEPKPKPENPKQPEPEKPKEEEKKPTPPEDASEEENPSLVEEEEEASSEPEPKPKPEPEEENEEVEEEDEASADDEKPPEESKGGKKGGEPVAAKEAAKVGEAVEMINSDEKEEQQSIKQRMVYYSIYEPLYFMERVPPPQLFSDENPNACCIS